MRVLRHAKILEPAELMVELEFGGSDRNCMAEVRRSSYLSFLSSRTTMHKLMVIPASHQLQTSAFNSKALSSPFTAMQIRRVTAKLQRYVRFILTRQRLIHSVAAAAAAGGSAGGDRIQCSMLRPARRPPIERPSASDAGSRRRMMRGMREQKVRKGEWRRSTSKIKEMFEDEHLDT